MAKKTETHQANQGNGGIKLDAIDRKILALLQKDCTLSMADIAARVGLSPSPCWRRIQNLEQAGIIASRVALLDQERLNLGVTVFVSVRTGSHSAAWLEVFSSAVTAIPEVTEFYRMSGQNDYLLKIVVPDIAAYDAVYKRLITAAELVDITSSFAMERIKFTTEMPLHYMASA